MALSRKLLESMGLEADKVGTIIEAHAETVDALKAQVATYKADAEKLADVTKQMETIKAENESLKGGDWQSKYEALNKEYELYKTEQANKESYSAKVNAYKTLLKDAGISEKRIDTVLKVSDLNGIVLENGAIKDADTLKDNIKTEWADFITTTATEGAQTAIPPKNDGVKQYTYDDIAHMSRDEINKNWEAVSASLSNTNNN